MRDLLDLNAPSLDEESRTRPEDGLRLVRVTDLQIKQEVQGVFDFMKHVYITLGFEFQLALSTRPEKFMGEIELWNNAEKVCG